jgi:hypothetical protein
VSASFPKKNEFRCSYSFLTLNLFFKGLVFLKNIKLNEKNHSSILPMLIREEEKVLDILLEFTTRQKAKRLKCAKMGMLEWFKECF